MRRLVSVLAVAYACTAALYAQNTTVRSKTKIKSDEAKTVTMTGCLATGTQQTKTYILERAMPIGQTTRSETTTGTSGISETTTTTTTTYGLVPSGRIDMQQN